MIKCLFTFAITLAFIAGCKSSSKAVNDLYAGLNDGDEISVVNDDTALTADDNDNSTDADNCHPISADCILRDECYGDPFSIAKCKGDVLHYCDEPKDPCYAQGSTEYWLDCNESGGRCIDFYNSYKSCRAQCLPLEDFTPADPFEGKWYETGYKECYTENILAINTQAIELLTFLPSNQFSIRWAGDNQTYTGVYENLKVKDSFEKNYLTTRWSFDDPYLIKSFSDYFYSAEDKTITLKFMNNGKDGLFYNGENHDSTSSLCGHIFNRIPEEQSNDDTINDKDDEVITDT